MFALLEQHPLVDCEMLTLRDHDKKGGKIVVILFKRKFM